MTTQNKRLALPVREARKMRGDGEVDLAKVERLLDHAWQDIADAQDLLREAFLCSDSARTRRWAEGRVRALKVARRVVYQNGGIAAESRARIEREA